MECSCLPNNGPAFTAQPHMIPGYKGYIPQFKYKFGNTFGTQTHRLFLDPCVSMSPRSVLTDICPEDCSSGGFLQSATGYKFGNCGCNDPTQCELEPQWSQGRNRGMGTKIPRFQTIMNQTYAPFCNRFCTKTFEQDQWRSKLFTREKEALDGWRYCYKSKPWDRPERTQPWDGDNSEYRKTSAPAILPPLMKDGECCDVHPYVYSAIRYKAAQCPRSNCRSVPISTGCCGREPYRKGCRDRKCPPCEIYQKYYKGVEKAAADIGLKGIVKHPLFRCPQGRAIRDSFCDDICSLKALNKEQMSRSPAHATEGIIEELGEPPIVTLHKLAEAREEASGKFYPEERGLARVCNPVGGSYLTARPFRGNPIYRYCEGVGSTYAGHVPGENLVVGEHRGKSTRNALKYMTFRI